MNDANQGPIACPSTDAIPARPKRRPFPGNSRRFPSRVGVAAIVGSLMAAFVAGGVAWAVVSPIDGNGVIHGCYNPNTGAFRLNVTGTYPTKGERVPITWNPVP